MKPPNYAPDPKFDQRLARTELVCRATHEEVFGFWRYWFCDEVMFRRYPRDQSEKDWQDESMGYTQIIGYLDERPVCLSINWDIIFGKRVMFWEMTSQVTDTVMAEKWLDEHLPGVERCDDIANIWNSLPRKRDESKTNS